MKAKAVDFISFSVENMDRAGEFWRDLLGLEVEVEAGRVLTTAGRATGF